jgi:cytidylate kinase
MRTQKFGETPGAGRLVERQALLSRLRVGAGRRGVLQEDVGRYRFVTVSREVGALGNFVASELAAHLNWQVFDKEIVDHVALSSHVRQELVQELDEKTRSLIHDTVERLLRMTEGISFGNEDYRKSLVGTLAYLATRGEAVLLGRGGAYALQGQPGLHIKVTASRKVRIERLSQRWGVRPDEARRRVHQIDSERRSFVYQHYRKHYDEPGFHDIIFNTDHVSIDQVVDSLLALLKS